MRFSALQVWKSLVILGQLACVDKAKVKDDILLCLNMMVYYVYCMKSNSS